MATRNWKYATSSNVAMTYNIPDYGTITIPKTNDGVKPVGFVYVDSLRGDDINGNGSQMYPYATITKNTTFDIAIVGSGTYRESGYRFGISIADGVVVLNGFGGLSFSNGGLCGFIAMNYLLIAPTYACNCLLFNNVSIQAPNMSNIANLYINRSVLVSNTTVWLNSQYSTIKLSNSVFYKNININYYEGVDDYSQKNNIFNYNNITFLTRGIKILYSNFNFNNIKFSSSYTAQTILPNINHKTTPLAGYTFIDGTAGHDIAQMQSLHNAAFNSVWPALGCTDDAINFVDTIGTIPNLLQDIAFSVKTGYTGQPIGIGAGVGFKVRSDANGCDFDHTNSINCNFADGVISFPNSAVNSVMYTKVKDISKVRNYIRSAFNGVQADRNGRLFSYNSDLSGTLINPGTGVLETNTCYMVVADTIIYNGTTIGVGMKFTTQTILDFSSSGAGVVQKVTQFPTIQTYRLRFSRTNADLSAKPWLIMRYGSDAIYSTDDGTTDGPNPVGNGDPNYNPAKSQPVYLRYFQEEHTANVSMLK